MNHMSKHGPKCLSFKDQDFYLYQTNRVQGMIIKIILLTVKVLEKSQQLSPVFWPLSWQTTSSENLLTDYIKPNLIVHQAFINFIQILSQDLSTFLKDCCAK